MPPEYLAALKAFALQSDVPLAEHVRGMVHDHILQRGAASRERGAALRALINAGKAWIIAYRVLLQLDWACERLPRDLLARAKSSYLKLSRKPTNFGRGSVNFAQKFGLLLVTARSFHFRPFRLES
jgi:hypothetical protein